MKQILLIILGWVQFTIWKESSIHFQTFKDQDLFNKYLKIVETILYKAYVLLHTIIVVNHLKPSIFLPINIIRHCKRSALLILFRIGWSGLGLVKLEMLE